MRPASIVVMGMRWARTWTCLAFLSTLALGTFVAAVHAAAPDEGAVPLQATSGDGRYVLVAQPEPPCLVVLDAARGEPVHTLRPLSRDGRVATRIAALRTAPKRRSFVVAPADLAELWEISYDPHAEDIYDGLVHDYRFGEGVPRRGFLGIRRTTLPEPLAHFVFDAHEAEAWALGAAPPAGSGEGHVINLDVRRRIAGLPASRVRAAFEAHQTTTPAPAVASSQTSARDVPASRAAPAHLTQTQTASRRWACAAP